MMLELRILTGKRRGHVFVLDPEAKNLSNLPYVLELEAIEFTLRVPRIESVSQVQIMLEDSSIDLSPLYDDEGKAVAFRASPSCKDGRMQALFYNYFGVAILYADVQYGSERELIELGQVEVLARKASVDQVEAMVEFIVSTSEDDLLRARGATRRSAGIVEESSKSPRRLLELLEINVSILEELLPYVIHAPLSSLSTKLEILPGSPDVDIQDQGIAWLGENMGVLEQCSDPESVVIYWQGQSLQAREVQASVMFENFDVYENRIILGYVDNLLEFTNELVFGLSEQKNSVSLNSHDGYVSFFSTVALRLLSNSSSQLSKAQSMHDRLILFRHRIASRLRLRKSDRTLPRFTPKVRANRYYSTLFRSIHEWYQGGKLNWNAQKLLLAIDNIPKLFELYTILVVRNWCSNYGIESNQSYKAFWQGMIDGFVVKLYYEPKYWMVGHVNQKGPIYNTENRTYKAAQNDRPGFVRSAQYGHRSPDIVLVVTGPSGKQSLLVLDAKYTDDQRAFEMHLPECIIKYVHGLAATDNSSLVASMFILFPDGLGGGRYLDFHAHPFCAFGASPQLPMLGAQGLSLGANGKEHDEEIHKLIKVALNAI